MSASSLAWRAVAWGLAIVLALQVWRPYFFLTDDNLVGWLPIVTAVGRNLLQGESPFLISELFAGFDLLRDPSALCLWNPLSIGLALLAQTPLQLATVDILVGFHLMLAAFCCAHLLARWRTMFGLNLSDRRLVFLSVSYAFSAFSIIVCASWNTFSCNIAAVPLALLGLFHPRPRTGVWLVVFSTWLSILAGHLSLFLWAALFLSLFALLWPWAAAGVSQAPPSTWSAWEVPRRWLVGSALGIGACAPLLAMAVGGFASTARDTGLSLDQIVWMRVPVVTMIGSWLVGSLSALLDAADPLLLVNMASGPSHAIGAALAAHFILLSIVLAFKPRRDTNGLGRGPANSLARVDLLFGALSIGVLLLVARPGWLQTVVQEVPLLRSLRFPFREIWLFHWWTHAWMAWRGGLATSKATRLSVISGASVMALSLLAWSPPTFTRIEATRASVVSGRAQKFWDRMRPILPPSSKILPVATTEQWKKSDELPLAMLGAFHFPALFEVPGASGYVIKGMQRGRMQRGDIGGPAGLRSPQQGQESLRRDSNIVLVRVVSLEPLRIGFEGKSLRRVVRADEAMGE